MPKSYLITNAPKKPRLARNIKTLTAYTKIVGPSAILVAAGVGAGILAEHFESSKYMR